MAPPKVIIIEDAKDVPRVPIDNKPTFVYWNILGLCQAIRLAMVFYSSNDDDEDDPTFVEVRIEPGEPDSPTCGYVWYHSKPKLEEILDFPNLPYYLDPNCGMNVTMTQSDAILRHIARTYGNKQEPFGSNPNDQYRVDMALGQLTDLNNQLIRLCYFDTNESLAEWYETSIPGILDQWERFLQGKDFINTTDGFPTIADFKLYGFLYVLRVIADKLECLSQDSKNILFSKEWIYPYMERIEKLPRIQQYMSSDDYMRRPLWSRHMAKFNN